MQLSLWQAADQSGSSRGRDLGTRRVRSASAGPAPRRELAGEGLDERAARYEKNAHAASTRAVYQAQWQLFERWCQANGECELPASTATLRRYLTYLAELGRKMSTIRHARSTIGLAHAHAGLPRPDRDERIRTLERGIAAEHGAHEQGVDPLLEHELAQVVAKLGASTRDVRDRAIILLGWAGAFRAADLACLDASHVTFTPSGLLVFLPRSKEDRLGRGVYTDVPCGAKPETCPAAALHAWLEHRGSRLGALFRVVQGDAITAQRISTRAPARAVQRAVKRAGLVGHYAAHSLRSGLATSAYAHGATEREIQAHGRWKDRRSLDRYIHVARMPGRKNVVVGLL